MQNLIPEWELNLPLKKLFAIKPHGLAGLSASMKYPENENPGPEEISSMFWTVVHFVLSVPNYFKSSKIFLWKVLEATVLPLIWSQLIDFT